ncbi:MAG: hypothetical protein II300_00170 [Bacteroidales bacterium]|nr:hypothetical protein [Bacteroidales bacterium]
MNELINEFNDLNAELAFPNCLNREEKLSRMREILKQICEIQNFTIDNIIDSMERQELIELNGTLNRIQGQQNRDEINELARNAQIDNNRYGPENPYPNN